MSEQDYALVSGGVIVAVYRANITPQEGDFSDEFRGGSKWLPIIDEATKHLRTAPRYEVGASVVRRRS
jgi:hypothetical protein